MEPAQRSRMDTVPLSPLRISTWPLSILFTLVNDFGECYSCGGGTAPIETLTNVRVVPEVTVSARTTGLWNLPKRSKLDTAPLSPLRVST